MRSVAEELRRESQVLLATIRTRTPLEALAAPVQRRQECLLEFEQALAGGECVTPEEARDLRQIDQEILHALRQRRDELFRELEILHRRCRLRAVYRTSRATAAHFVDRAG